MLFENADIWDCGFPTRHEPAAARSEAVCGHVIGGTWSRWTASAVDFAGQFNFDFRYGTRTLTDGERAALVLKGADKLESARNGGGDGPT